jgi:phosphatidylglycerophosphatase A
MARRHKLETPFGRVLDPTADKVFILATMVSFALKGAYSYWFLVPIFIREIGVTFCRVVWLRAGHAIGAERAGKLKLGLQVTSISFSFIYLFLPNPTTYSLNLFFISAALLLTVYSGFFFLLHNRRLLQDKELAKAVASVGVGNLRPFPGTYGSLVGLAIVPLVAYDLRLYFLVLSGILILAYTMIPRLGLGPKEDPLEIVIDEVAGILVSFWSVPVNAVSLVAGFLIFRFFDVFKIFPVNWFEKKPGVHGIMLDDIAAGVYTWVILKILFH